MRGSTMGLMAALGAGLGAGAATAQTPPPDFARMEVHARPVAANFYVIDETPAHGGSISVLTGPDGVLLVDTGVGGLVEKVAAEIRRISPQPVRYVITTHAHVDEIGGNEHFAGLGATVIGRDAARAAILNPRPRPAGAATGREARQRMPSAASAPRITFSDAMALHLNGQDVRLLAVPAAHTSSDTIILFPAIDVIVTGDVLRAHEYPSIGRADGGTFAGLLAGLDRLIALGGDKTRYVTSHGQIVDRAVVIEHRTLLVTTRARVAALIGQGRSVEQIVAANVSERLGAHQEPGHVSAEQFVRDVYAEASAVR